MYKIRFQIWLTFISKNKNHSLGLMSAPKDFHQVIQELTLVFNPTYEYNKVIGDIASLIICTPFLKSRVSEYVDTHKKTSPSLNKLKKFIYSLGENEGFYLLPAVKNAKQIEIIKIKNILSLANLDPISKEKYMKSFELFTSNLLANYSIDGLDPSDAEGKIKIGEGFKANRICRFCGNKNTSPTTFTKEAHAISESLGNKKLILNEECDACNEYFDINIERDLDAYLKLYSSFFRLKNKDNKVSKIKGQNFTFEYINKEIEGAESDSRHIDFVLQHYPANPNLKTLDSHPPQIIDLIFYQKIRRQNIYKTLVKFALSVMKNRNELSMFDETIKWISSPTEFKSKLPKIAIMKNYGFFRKEPSLLVFKSIKNTPELPYAIGEFHYTFLTYIFIIPLFVKGETDFSHQNNFEHFKNFFPHFTKVDEWDFEDFSEHEEKQLVINMMLTQTNSQ